MATILRENKKGLGDSTYLLRMKYTCIDAKKALQRYAEYNQARVKSPKTKEAYVKIFCDDMLSFLPKRNAVPLAEWLFVMSVKNGYLVEVPQIWVGEAREYVIAANVLEKQQITNK